MGLDAFPTDPAADVPGTHWPDDGCDPIVHARLDAAKREAPVHDRTPVAVLPKVARAPIAFVFPSSHDGYPHVVTRSELDVVGEYQDSWPRLSCTCKGSVRESSECWAIKWVRALLPAIVVG